ncbi:MAG: hypothetical protein ACI9BO_000346 [Zhongshania sp.]|jgi:hypothetical protein
MRCDFFISAAFTEIHRHQPPQLYVKLLRLINTPLMMPLATQATDLLFASWLAGKFKHLAHYKPPAGIFTTTNLPLSHIHDYYTRLD